MQGDIVRVYNSEGVKLVSYVYTAWGDRASTTYHHGGANTTVTNNPFTYRGYYYDNDLDLYYLQSRYYDSKICRFISPDEIGYLGANGDMSSYNLYAYCSNDPINYADPSGCFPVLACILGLTALVGMGLTIGGIASDNNVMTGIGLTMVATPALISGGMALYCAGAAGTMVMGGITTAAGVATGLFASSEYQEAFTGNNWMLDSGMSEECYNGLMLTTASIATAGTVASMAGVTRYRNFGNKNWLGGWRKMRSHYLKHGRPQMGYRSVFDYTNGANAIINNGGIYISNANSYAQWIAGNRYLYVGVGRDSSLITTYFMRTIKYAKYLSLL